MRYDNKTSINTQKKLPKMADVNFLFEKKTRVIELSSSEPTSDFVVTQNCPIARWSWLALTDLFGYIC